ncbi:superoxide dismutase family protein [Alkalilimnicola ehrlichii]|uniref:Superoxide dismutase [Cu-Zn] n=1 Tax=Alkalilimnicola ehrlichii TaxID=351052 RepID=A0A3E0WVX5_9GAMM|nr:superoxide dismutase family protein [Alkalilimnicola ehrlichii]RFA36549.1 superoxide dismutase [Alkalilimnicola ehrlichii]
MKCWKIALGLMLGGLWNNAQAVTVEMHSIDDDGVGQAIGTVELADHAGGLLLTPDLQGLPPGARGFHLHEYPRCEPGEDQGHGKAGMAAGGPYDPHETGRHEGPYGDGYLGNLPILYVRADGSATDPVLAPRLTLDDVPGLSLVVYEGGDNYSDDPEPNGGGGTRIACGVIPE